MLSNKNESLNLMQSMNVFVPNATQQELLMTSVPPPDANVQMISIQGTPLRTKKIQWPEQTSSLCLHCAGHCNRGPPLPAVKYYDPQQQQYWVYGPFCSAACSYGFICSTDNSNATKQMALTHKILRDYFHIDKVSIAPPRSSHQRFGGPMNDFDFYSYEDSNRVVDVLEPPFVTFAHYVLAVHQNEHKSVTNTYDLLPQSAGRLINLRRPSERKHPLAKKTSTDHPPFILNYLATMDVHQEQPRSNAAQDSGSKKRSRVDNDEINVRGVVPVAPKGFLARYVKHDT